MDRCNHSGSYFFHDNGPQFCPVCENYLTDEFISKERTIKQRRKKINKILQK